MRWSAGGASRFVASTAVPAKLGGATPSLVAQDTSWADASQLQRQLSDASLRVIAAPQKREGAEA